MGTPGFDHVLQRVAAAWHEQREQVLDQSREVTSRPRNKPLRPCAAATSGTSIVDRDPDPPAGEPSTVDKTSSFQWGGFGEAPKFPHSMHLDFLLRARHSGDLAPNLRSETVLDMVRLNLDGMAYGGCTIISAEASPVTASTNVGWCRISKRCSTTISAADTRLLATSFAKLVSRVFAAVARETLDYLLRDTQDSAGGFHSSEDADSEGGEASSTSGAKVKSKPHSVPPRKNFVVSTASHVAEISKATTFFSIPDSQQD
jgi:uncharacterized protein YyaL (SSP411 family)